jgi:Family of unknown function (DUF5681)
MALPNDVTDQSMDESSEKPASAKEQKVGYRSPPVATRFKKGRSGNPKGRPKRQKTLEHAVVKVLGEKIWAHENGRRKVYTKRDACAKTLVNKAASGDLKSIRLIVDIDRLNRREIEAVEKQDREIDLRLPEGLSARERLIELTARLRARFAASQGTEENRD